MEGGDGPVIVEAVVPTDNSETDDVAIVVEDLEALGAGLGGETRHHLDLAERAHVPVAVDHVAALEEVLVCLRVVKAAHHGPDSGDGRVDGLHHGRAALLGRDRVGVVASHGVGYRDDRVGGSLGGFGAVDGGGVGSAELDR